MSAASFLLRGWFEGRSWRRNTLGLDDDLDPSELQNALEASFGIRLSVPEATACRTVDEIFQLIRSRLSPIREGVDGCATAMALYRLRRALSDLHTRSPLTPTIDVVAFPGLSARRLLETLRQCPGFAASSMESNACGQGRQLDDLRWTSIAVSDRHGCTDAIAHRRLSGRGRVWPDLD